MGLVESNQRQVSSNGLPVGQSLGAGNLPGTKPESFYRVSWGKVMMRAYVLSKTATLLGEACRSLSCLDFPVSILFHSFPSFSINFHHFPSFSQTEGFSSLWGVTTIGSLPTAGPQAWLNLAVRLGILKSKEVYKYSISMYIISAYHHFPIFSPLKCCI